MCFNCDMDYDLADLFHTYINHVTYITFPVSHRSFNGFVKHLSKRAAVVFYFIPNMSVNDTSAETMY